MSFRTEQNLIHRGVETVINALLATLLTSKSIGHKTDFREDISKNNLIRRGIEVVITGLTRNQFVPKAHEGSNPSLCAKDKRSALC